MVQIELKNWRDHCERIRPNINAWRPLLPWTVDGKQIRLILCSDFGEVKCLGMDYKNLYTGIGKIRIDD